MVMEGDLTWGGEHTVQCIGDALQNCTSATYITVLTNVTPINSIKKEMHFKYEDPHRFKSRGLKKIHHTNSNPKKTGVAL